MIGKRVQLDLPCPGCGEKHYIWIPGSDYFDNNADNQFRCPTTTVVYRLTGIVAADLEVDCDPTDILGWTGENEPTDSQDQKP